LIRVYQRKHAGVNYTERKRKLKGNYKLPDDETKRKG